MEITRKSADLANIKFIDTKLKVFMMISLFAKQRTI